MLCCVVCCADTVEAEELSSLDKLIAQTHHSRHISATKNMRKACVKGDAACLKKEQEKEQNKLKAKLVCALTTPPSALFFTHSLADSLTHSLGATRRPN